MSNHCYWKIYLVLMVVLIGGQRYNMVIAGLSKFPKLLVVAFDGLRWDFINEAKTRELYQIAQQGAWARNGLKNEFITKTAAIFYSLSTGLYQESTGILGNEMYDPRYGGGNDSYYDYWGFMNNEYITKHSRDAKWYSGIPIWQVNDAADPGRHSGCLAWPMGDANVNDKKCYKDQKWEGYGNETLDRWIDHVDTMVSWFQSDVDPVNLGLLYVGQPDHREHGEDIYDLSVQKVLDDLDTLALYIMNKLKTLNLTEQINVIFTADHGHVDVFKKYQYIDLDQYIDPYWYIETDWTYHPNVTNGINATTLYDALYDLQQKEPKFYLFCKCKAEIPSCIQEIPDEFHYKDNPRTGPIIVSPYLGYYIDSYKKNPKGKDLKPPAFGSHGYSPEYKEMWPFFIGIGPQFRGSYSFWNMTYQIDLFELMCHMLDITPVSNNGSFDRIKHVLKNDASVFTGQTLILFVVFSCLQLELV